MKSRAMMMYHPNARGTGSAMKLELAPADGNIDGSISVTLAPQVSVGSSVTNPGFDWTKSVSVNLNIFELARFIQVLRGMEESIEDGKGLFQRTTTENMVVKFEHRIEPIPGYLLDVSAKPYDGDVKRVCFHLRQEEALALLILIEQSLSVLAFGVPSFDEGEQK